MLTSRKLLALLYSLTLGLSLGVLACQRPQDASMAVEVPVQTTPQGMLAELQQADVIYLGERHDSTADHAAQLAIVQALHQQNPNLAIAMEMFQRPFQPVLDRYIAGEISEADLVAGTEYETRWGFPWELYAPILRFAQAQKIPVLALNAPREVVRKVARQGLESLQPEDWTYIPPQDQIDTSNAAYRQYVRQAFGGHGGHGTFNFDHFFTAQVIWDETMAANISQFRQANPDHTVVVLAGQGHVVYGYGIPDRVERRLGPQLQQKIVLLNPPLDAARQDKAIADVIWQSPDR